MRKLTCAMLTVLMLATASFPAQEVLADGRTPRVDQEHTQWIDKVILSIATVKPGMTRKDLAKVLVGEGGLSSRTQRRYVYIHCPHIKVDVDFAPADDSNGGNDDASIENPDDVITKVSQPFLEFSIMD